MKASLYMKSKRSFYVEAITLDEKSAEELLKDFQKWIDDKRLPTDKDYMAALGPCGK
jgi:hypothetical protein